MASGAVRQSWSESLEVDGGVAAGSARPTWRPTSEHGRAARRRRRECLRGPQGQLRMIRQRLLRRTPRSSLSSPPSMPRPMLTASMSSTPAMGVVQAGGERDGRPLSRFLVLVRWRRARVEQGLGRRARGGRRVVVRFMTKESIAVHR